MRRTLEPEILDRLPVNDPRAVQSRRDLRKVNTFMGHAGVMTRALRGSAATPRLVVELGAGDGSLLLRIAKRLDPGRSRVRAILVDRAPSLSSRARSDFDSIGWDVEVQQSDVFEWLSATRADVADVMLANLFLHHFNDDQLSTLLAAVSRQTERFIACEPLRSRTALAGASLLVLIGCNEVTRHDAGLSVRAGFCGRELSAIWPSAAGWRLTESRAGLFTHFFGASKLARATRQG
jgi:SAM-dependent methyltransferase